MSGHRTFQALRLVVALALFTGWMAYLGYAALHKSGGPIVSHIQAAAATLVIVAEVEAKEDATPSKEVAVVEVLRAREPGDETVKPGHKLLVSNLSDVQGFGGKGPYLLLLVRDTFAMQQFGHVPPVTVFTYSVVGQKRSPGTDLTGIGKPLIYPWNDDVRQQFENLNR